MHQILDFKKPFHEKVDMKIDGSIFDEKGNFVANIFNLGKSLAKFKFKIQVQSKYSKNGKLRDKLWVQVNRSTLLFVASPGVLDLFREFKIEDVEFLDVEIEGEGIEIKDYKLINILRRIDCADDLNSEFIYVDDTDEIYAIEELVLDQEKIPTDLDIFQMARTENNVTIVSQRFVDEVNERGLTGFIFVPSEEFTIN
jgi:hypothetical protein